MKSNTVTKELFEECISIIIKSKKLVDKITDVAALIIECFNNGNKVIVFGNGGSAADAQHLAAEFVGRYKIERKSLPCIALTTDTSIITALGNDYGFDYVFARQCESIVRQGDIVIAISTSGKSLNVVNGISTSKKHGALIIGLTGEIGGSLSKLSNIVLKVPSKSTPRIQEVHRIILHIICAIVDEYYKKERYVSNEK